VAAAVVAEAVVGAAGRGATLIKLSTIVLGSTPATWPMPFFTPSWATKSNSNSAISGTDMTKVPLISVFATGAVVEAAAVVAGAVVAAAVVAAAVVAAAVVEKKTTGACVLMVAEVVV